MPNGHATANALVQGHWKKQTTVNLKPFFQASFLLYMLCKRLFTKHIHACIVFKYTLSPAIPLLQARPPN